MSHHMGFLPNISLLAHPHLCSMSLINGNIPIYGNQYVMEGSDFAALFVRREVGDEL